MTATTVITDPNAVFDALEKWIKQRPKLDPANYGVHPEQLQYSSREQRKDARRAYASEIRDIGNQRKRAMKALETARALTPAKPKILADAFSAFSGRLEWNGKELDYTTGQYFPTEYRSAAAAVLESYIMGWRQWYASENPKSFTYDTVQDVREANAAVGQHFFSRSTMRFFNSRVASGLIAGRYFVTSEQFDDRSARLFTIREAKPDASVDTVGKFQGYRTLGDAKEAIRAILREKVSDNG